MIAKKIYLLSFMGMTTGRREKGVNRTGIEGSLTLSSLSQAVTDLRANF